MAAAGTGNRAPRRSASGSRALRGAPRPGARHSRPRLRRSRSLSSTTRSPAPMRSHSGRSCVAGRPAPCGAQRRAAPAAAIALARADDRRRPGARRRRCSATMPKRSPCRSASSATQAARPLRRVQPRPARARRVFLRHRGAWHRPAATPPAGSRARPRARRSGPSARRASSRPGAVRRRARRRGTARTPGPAPRLRLWCRPMPCSPTARREVRRRSFSRARTCGGMKSAMAGAARTRRVAQAAERHAAQQRGDHVVGALLLGLGGERQQQAMAHHRRGQRERRPRASRPGGRAAARAPSPPAPATGPARGPAPHFTHWRTSAGAPSPRPAGAHQARDPGQQVVAQVHFAHARLQRQHRLAVHHLRHLRRRACRWSARGCRAPRASLG